MVEGSISHQDRIEDKMLVDLPPRSTQLEMGIRRNILKSEGGQQDIGHITHRVLIDL